MLVELLVQEQVQELEELLLILIEDLLYLVLTLLRYIVS